jgi:hypothetical protein
LKIFVINLLILACRNCYYENRNINNRLKKGDRMKKLQLLTVAMLTALFATISLVEAKSAELAEFERLGQVAPARRNKMQKEEYRSTKAQKSDFVAETAEFRFALKLEEYYRKFLAGEMTLLSFIEEISRKIANYLENKQEHIHHAATQKEITDFLNDYLSMSLEDLQAKVGEKEEDLMQRTQLGRMKRYHTER